MPPERYDLMIIGTGWHPRVFREEVRRNMVHSHPAPQDTRIEDWGKVNHGAESHFTARRSHPTHG